MSAPSVRYASTWKKPPFIKNPALRWSILIAAIVYFVVALSTMEINRERVAEGIPRGITLLSKFFPPNLEDSRGVIVDGILESIWMAIIATVGGVLLSVPIGLGAARNLSPTWVYLVCRSIISVSRTFPEIILAIFAVKFFGFGPFAGFVALSIGTIGFYAKLLAEDIENMSKSQAEAVRVTGSSWLQWVNFAVQPQVMPRMIGLALYRLDINFRESAVVGIVGAGGIGAHLLTSVQRYEYDTTATILITIIAIVITLEYTSGYLRKRVQ
jgi:phosphonate transport system permease protein